VEHGRGRILSHVVESMLSSLLATKIALHLSSKLHFLVAESKQYRRPL
jgi:hypothetical protein